MDLCNFAVTGGNSTGFYRFLGGFTVWLISRRLIFQEKLTKHWKRNTGMALRHHSSNKRPQTKTHGRFDRRTNQTRKCRISVERKQIRIIQNRD